MVRFLRITNGRLKFLATRWEIAYVSTSPRRFCGDIFLIVERFNDRLAAMVGLTQLRCEIHMSNTYIANILASD